MFKLLRHIARTLTGFLIICALIVLCIRFVAANIGFFRADIEAWADKELVSGINFGDIRCYWQGINPILELEKAAVILPDLSRPVAVDILSVQFDLWNSLVLGTPVIQEIQGDIEKLVIRKDIQQNWWLNDVDLKVALGNEAAISLEGLLATIPHFLQLELKRLIIEDETKQRVHQIDNILADIQYHHQTVGIQLLADLPEALGGTVKLKSLLQGDTGVIYLATEQIRLAPIAALLDMPLKNFRRVELAGETWLNLRDHHISGISGNIHINKASYQPKLDEPTVPLQFSMSFRADKQIRHWQFASRVEQLVINHRRLADINAQWHSPHDPTDRHIQGWIEELPIADYVDLGQAYMPEEFRQTVLQSNIQGKLEDIWFSWPLETPSEIMLMASANHLQNQVAGPIPGINQLRAEVFYANQQAAINLSSDQLVVDFGDLFRAPLEIDTLHARADAKLINGEVVLSLSDVKVTNQDIRIDGRFWLENDFSTAPFVSMRLNFDQAVIGQKSKYLPVKLLPETVLRWLDEGLRSGDATNGEVLFHGRLEDIEALTDHQSGELYVGFDISNSDIMFHEAWEAVEQAQGYVLFHNMGFEIELKQADYDAIEPVRANIKLPDYDNSEVFVDISALTDAESALKVWLASPVSDNYGDIAADLQQLAGQITANINLFVPLDDNQQTIINADIDLHDVAIQVPDWGIQLSRTKGRVTVTGDTVSAIGKAYYFNDPIDIEVTTSGQRQTRIRVDGLVDSSRLFNQLPPGFRHSFAGKSRWQADWVIEHAVQTDDQAILTIHATSDLQGTAIDLPAPFNKRSGSKRRINSTITWGADNQLSFEAAYGTQVKARGRLQNNNMHQSELTALDIAFAAPLKPESDQGIRLYGDLVVLSVDEWITDYRSKNVGQRSDSLVALLQSIDLTILEATLAGHILPDTRFQLTRTQAGFQGYIDSSVAKGRFFSPGRDQAENPLSIDLDYLHVEKKAVAGVDKNWIPDDFFDVQLRSRVFSYDGREVIDLKMDMSLDDGSLLIDRLNFRHDDIRFGARGYWLYNPVSKIHDSYLELSIQGEKFGQSMAALGFGDVMQNGRIEFNGELGWPAAIMNPNWDILNGKGSLLLEDGVFKNIEPGSGRFVGLLSFSALPRRLFLDFSDVLADGLEFDRIKGDMQLKGPNLYTSNTRLNGPSSKIRIVGRTGVRDRDYDQKIYVLPKVRQTLPVIGGAIGGAPVGWSLLLFENLFKSSLDKSFTMEYNMTGSWDDPVIVAVEAPRSASEKILPGIDRGR